MIGHGTPFRTARRSSTRAIAGISAGGKAGETNHRGGDSGSKWMCFKDFEDGQGRKGTHGTVA